MENKISILVHTCDSYKFLWKGFVHYWKQYWVDKSIVKYFCNEEKDVNFDGFLNIKTGKGEWSDRLEIALNLIQTEYVLYVQEDMWLKKSLPKNLLRKLLNIMEERDILCIRIFPKNKLCSYEFETPPLRKMSRNSLYLLNHQISIWNREFFLTCLEKHETPWVNEKEGTKRLRDRPEGDKIYQYCVDWYESVSKKGEFTKIGVKLLNDIYYDTLQQSV